MCISGMFEASHNMKMAGQNGHCQEISLYTFFFICH
uniref:Uncharacterized protein n=1 Tax=Arundo donax TaxID=35708 RepID=A0A0A9H2H6_ARUDO